MDTNKILDTLFYIDLCIVYFVPILVVLAFFNFIVFNDYQMIKKESCMECAYFNRINRFEYMICKDCDRKNLCIKIKR